MSQGFFKERHYISWKQKYADIRRMIPYVSFIHANHEIKKKKCNRGRFSVTSMPSPAALRLGEADKLMLFPAHSRAYAIIKPRVTVDSSQ